MYRIFDIITFAYLVFSLYVVYLLISHFLNLKKFERIKKKHWQISVLVFFLVTASLVFYGSFIEPQIILTKKIDIDLNKTDAHENIKLVFVSDYQLGPYKKGAFLLKSIAKIKSLDPDFVLLGGDFIFLKEKEGKYFEKIYYLSKNIPTFAVMGNHEYHTGLKPNEKTKQEDRSGLLREILIKNEVAILDNENILLEKDGAKFYLIGLDSLEAGLADYNKALADTEKNLAKILLVHTPDFILEQPNEVDLILSGHTHGGQFRLPWLGSFAPIPTWLGRSFDQGLFEFENFKLLITSGLGETGARARLFNPPEIVLINLDL